MILKIIIAILISTSAMAILEPCLPIWLMKNLHPKVIEFYLSQKLLLLKRCETQCDTFLKILYYHKCYNSSITAFYFQKWQIGTVFIPDSVGYFIGTNFFASIAFKLGQMKLAVLSLLVVGLSCFFVSIFSRSRC